MRTAEQRARNTELVRRRREADPQAFNAYIRAYREKNAERMRAYYRQLYHRNKAERAAYARRNRALNREHVAANARCWRERNKERINAREREKRAADPVRANAARKKRETQPRYKIINAVRDAVRRMAKRGAVKEGPSVKYLGASLATVRAHIESLWLPGMTWENYGFFGWHIDHIRPLAAFEVTNQAELQKAAHYLNLQPLWWSENLSKSNK